MGNSSFTRPGGGFDVEPVHGSATAPMDGWRWQHPRPGQHFRTCSYCGSIHPEDLATESVWQPSWADQKYGWPHKFFLSLPNREPGTIFAVGVSYAVDPMAMPGEMWVAWPRLTADQLGIAVRDQIVSADDRHPNFILFRTRKSHSADFHTAHLADPRIPEQAREAVQDRCGRRFFFNGEEVQWQPFDN